MTELETKVAEARKRLEALLFSWFGYFDDEPVDAIIDAVGLPQIIAEKDDEITKLRNLVQLRHSKQCDNDECDLCEAVELI